MPLPQSTATSTATKLRDLISSTLNLLTYSQDSDQEESEKETIAQYKGYLMAVYRIRDHVYLLVKDSILTSEAAKSLLEILETMELNLERHLANMSKEDLQVATGEELRKSLQETYEIIADKSGTTVNRLIMKVKEMILATGYNYVIKDGEITMEEISTQIGELRLEEEEFLTPSADGDVGSSTTDVTTCTTNTSGGAIPTAATGSAHQSPISLAQPIVIVGRPKNEHRRFVRRYNAESSSTLDTVATSITDSKSNTTGRLAEYRVAGLAPALHLAADERWVAKPEISQAQQHFQTSTASLGPLELPSELNPGPLAALVAPNEADSKTTALLGSRPITGDVLPVVRDQKSQQPAEQDSSQEARQSLEAATGTQLTHTRRNEYPTRDADWMRRAPLPIIPFSGKTPDGGSAASLNSVGTPSTDGKIYTKW